LAIYLLVSNARLISAMRLNENFMPDMSDDNELIKEVSKVTSISTEDEEMVDSVVKKEQE
jgi:hypothetical protein